MTESLSIVIPVYNSEPGLDLLISRLVNVLPSCASDFEIILVNDNSRDKSWLKIAELSSKVSAVRGINLSNNFGQHHALLCGIRHARKEIVITLDDDLQNPPEEIPKLLSKYREGFDVVYGDTPTRAHTFLRRLGSKTIRLALKAAMKRDIAAHVSPFRVFRTSLRDAFSNYDSNFVIIDVLLSWSTSSFAYVDVQHDKRHQGVSNYNIRKLIVFAVNMFTGFSTLPLRIASYLGFFLTFFGVFLLVYVVAAYMVYGGGVPGFPFLAATLTIFSGAQLFALGIIGEYLAKIYFGQMKKPVYVVKEVVGK